MVIQNSPMEMLVETQKTLDMKWVQLLIKAAAQGGANEGSTSRTQQDNNNAESSIINLQRERVWSRDHPWELIIGNPEAGFQTGRASQNECYFYDFLSEIQTKKVEEALEDPDWVIAMQEELNQFERQKV